MIDYSGPHQGITSRRNELEKAGQYQAPEVAMPPGKLVFYVRTLFYNQTV